MCKGDLQCNGFVPQMQYDINQIAITHPPNTLCDTMFTRTHNELQLWLCPHVIYIVMERQYNPSAIVAQLPIQLQHKPICSCSCDYVAMWFTMQWNISTISIQYQQYCWHNAQFNWQLADMCYVCADWFTTDIVFYEWQPECVTCCSCVKVEFRNEIPVGGGTWVYASIRDFNTMDQKNGVTRGQVISIFDWYSRPFLVLASIAGGARGSSVFLININ